MRRFCRYATELWWGIDDWLPHVYVAKEKVDITVGVSLFSRLVKSNLFCCSVCVLYAIPWVVGDVCNTIYMAITSVYYVISTEPESPPNYIVWGSWPYRYEKRQFVSFSTSSFVPSVQSDVRLQFWDLWRLATFVSSYCEEVAQTHHIIWTTFQHRTHIYHSYTPFTTIKNSTS